MTATVTSARVLGVVTAVAAAAVVAGPTAVAVPGGLLLAFALPGLALTGVVFRRHELSAVERVVLAPALSLATLILSGLLMNAAGIALDRAAWTSATAGVTLLALFAGALPPRVGPTRGVTGGAAAGRREPAMAAATAARAAIAEAASVTRAPAGSSLEDTVRLVVVPPLTDRKVPLTDQQAPMTDPTAPVTGPEPSTSGSDTPTGAGGTTDGDSEGEGTIGGGRSVPRQLLPLILAVLIAGGAGWLSFDSSRSSATQTLTTLSAAAPGAVSAAGTRAVRVTATGLASAEGPFTVTVRDGDGRSLERRAVTAVDGTWTTELSLPADERVTVDLLRAADPTPYRTVIIAAAE